MVRLIDVCDLNMGQSPDSSSYNQKAIGMPFYQGNADFGEIHPQVRFYCDSPVKTAHADDILLSVRAPIGAINIAKETCCIGRGLAAITVKACMDMKFLYHVLLLKNTELNAKGTGSTFKAITKQSLSDLRVPYPPLDIQKKISSILDSATEHIGLRKQRIVELDNLIKSRFVEMFGDGCSFKPMQLSDIALIAGGLTKNENKRKHYETKMPYLRVANVFFNQLDLSEVFDLPIEPNELEKGLLHKDDLLFVEGNGSIEQIGRVAIWNGKIDPCVHQNHLIRVRCDQSRLNPIYALHYFMLPDGRKQIMIKAVSTSGLHTLSVSKIENLIVPLPALDLQNCFAAFVLSADKSKFYTQKTIDESQLLFNSLMSRYFN